MLTYLHEHLQKKVLFPSIPTLINYFDINIRIINFIYRKENTPLQIIRN